MFVCKMDGWMFVCRFPMNEFILLIHCFHDDEVFELRIGSSVKSLPVEWGLIKADWRHWLKKNDEIHVFILFVVGRTFQDVCLTSFVLSPSIHFFFLLPHQVDPLPLVHFSQGPDREFRRFFCRDDTGGRFSNGFSLRVAPFDDDDAQKSFFCREEVKNGCSENFGADFFRGRGKIGGGVGAGEPFCCFYVRSLRRGFRFRNVFGTAALVVVLTPAAVGSSLGPGAPRRRESAAPVPAKGDGSWASEKRAFFAVAATASSSAAIASVGRVRVDVALLKKVFFLWKEKPRSK